VGSNENGYTHSKNPQKSHFTRLVGGWVGTRKMHKKAEKIAYPVRWTSEGVTGQKYYEIGSFNPLSNL
jgi:hypothetical protein